MVNSVLSELTRGTQMSEIKKFIVASINGTFRNKPKSHALKGDGKKNKAWCGCKFKKAQIKEKNKLPIEYITCQKCVNTISKHINEIV